MSNLDFKYRLQQIPPLWDLILLSLQWLIITIPILLIMGKVVAGLHFENILEQTVYLQKLFFVTAVTILIQIFLGHGLPIIMGPAAVLLAGIVAVQGNSIAAIYSSIMFGGLALAILSMTGLFGYLKSLFTSRVIAATLILIAFTLTPMITNLISSAPPGVSGFTNFVFALCFVFSMFIANKLTTGIWKATITVWGIIFGSLIYNFIYPVKINTGLNDWFSPFFKDFTLNIAFEPGIIVSFLICFLALSINDLGSIQSVNELINPDNKERRIARGITFTGLGNILAGFFGVIGLVNFSLSPGVIVSTKCASKYTLVPMGFGLLILSFFPGVIAFMGSIPTVVIGSALIYLMCSQIAAGLMVALKSAENFTFEHGLAIGLSLMLSIVIAILPAEFLNSFPAIIRPILGNGFVMGVLAILIMEHLIFKGR
ncbi:MAG: purine/pyrimidine permease [Clostridia bacterium]|nr:purine/pyrimidine permease [Clostridia bacterium]